MKLTIISLAKARELAKACWFELSEQEVDLSEFATDDTQSVFIRTRGSKFDGSVFEWKLLWDSRVTR